MELQPSIQLFLAALTQWFEKFMPWPLQSWKGQISLIPLIFPSAVCSRRLCAPVSLDSTVSSLGPFDRASPSSCSFGCRSPGLAYLSQASSVSSYLYLQPSLGRELDCISAFLQWTWEEGSSCLQGGGRALKFYVCLTLVGACSGNSLLLECHKLRLAFLQLFSSVSAETLSPPHFRMVTKIYPAFIFSPICKQMLLRMTQELGAK